MNAHVVEILFTRHCRHLSEAIESVRVASRAAEEIEVRLVQLQTMRAFGLHDRDYVVDGRIERAPPREWIAKAL